jgi:hypothetical protein
VFVLALILAARLVEAVFIVELTEAVPAAILAASEEDEFSIFVLAVVTFVPTVASVEPRLDEAAFVLLLTLVVSAVTLAAVASDPDERVASVRFLVPKLQTCDAVRPFELVAN